MEPAPGLAWFEKLIIDLVSEPMAPLTLAEAAGLTDRQILDVYVYPRMEKAKQDAKPTEKPQTTVSPNVIADPDNKGMEWHVPPASPDAEITVHGKPCDPEPFIENLVRLGVVKAENYRTVREKIQRAKEVRDATGARTKPG